MGKKNKKRESRVTLHFLVATFVCCCVCAQSCLTLCDTMDCSLPGSSVHGISQTRILEWAAIFFSRESSQPRDRTHISCIGRLVLYHWVTWEATLNNQKEIGNFNSSLLNPIYEKYFHFKTWLVVIEITLFFCHEAYSLSGETIYK